MQSFEDATGRTWTISLTIGSMNRVQAVTKVDLLDPMALDKDGVPTYVRIRTDERLMAKVLWEVLSTEGGKEKLNSTDFLDALDADTCDRAWEAFMEEWLSFFRSRGRNNMVKSLAKYEEAMKVFIQMDEDRIDEINVQEFVEKYTE